MTNQMNSMSMSSMILDGLRKNRYDIIYLQEYEIIVCLICGYGVNGPPGIRRHLISRHSYGWREAKKIEDGFQGLKILSHTDTRPREPGLKDPPICFLKLYKKGLDESREGTTAMEGGALGTIILPKVGTPLFRSGTQ